MKVPTKHGLDRKFKPWRKGKSAKSNKRSSLKQQLRGHERLLAKISKSGEDEEKTKELRGKIASLKEEISQKQQSMVEKKHAEKAHGQRFLDRQRLVRSEKKVKKSSGKEEELLKIALDQVYVAHHPNDVKYMPLFKHGKRVVDQSRQLFRRAVTRKRILGKMASTTRVNWIGDDQYERLPKSEWTIQDEERVFGGSISRSAKDSKKSNKVEDSRFAMASNHGALLKAAEQAETDLLKDEEEDEKIVNTTEAVEKPKLIEKSVKEDSSSSSSDSSSDSEDEEANPLSSKPPAKETNKQQQKQKDDSSSSSDSDSSSSSSDDSDDEIDAAKPTSKTAKQTKDDDSSSSSDSDSSSDSNDDEEEKKPSSAAAAPAPMEKEEEEEEIDDFLVDATDNDDVFNKPAVRIPALSNVRGDKSKGFETQSQRPGEYRKKRVRRRY